MLRYLLPICMILSVYGLTGCDQLAPSAGSGELTKKESSLLTLGRSMQENRNYSQAEKFFLEAKSMDSGGIDSDLALAGLYFEQGDSEKAGAALAEAEKRAPDNAQLNRALGKLNVEQGKPEKALGYFERGLKTSPDDINLLNGKGVALDMLSRNDEAQAVYQEALTKSTPEDRLQIDNNLALSYIMAGKYDKAITLLEKIKGVEDVAVMRQNLALAYGLKGDMKKAREWGGKDMDPKKLEENMRFYQQYRNSLILKKTPPQLKPVPARN